MNMENYVTSVKDLVIESLSSFTLIKTSADNRGEANACLKMGLIHLLGINTPVNFRKAIDYFNKQALADNQEVIPLLAFTLECEGNFSQAFQYYAKSVGNEQNTYIEKVIQGRNELKEYIKKLDLPLTLNQEITSILNAYSKGKASKVGASVKIAAICNDEQSCIEAARSLFIAKDYISAIQWLKKGNISKDNTLYNDINDAFIKSRDKIISSKELHVIDIDGTSLLSKEDPTPFLNNIRETCEAASKKCSMEWKEKTKKRIDTIIKIQKETEQNMYLASLAEEEAKKKAKRKKYILIGIAFWLLCGLFTVLIPSSNNNSDTDESNNNEYVLTGNKKFHGNVDKYPITMELQIEGEKVKGSLYYDKYGPENILILSGSLNKNEIELNESEKNGKPTGHFRGNYSNGVFQGEYTTSNGKSMSFAVSE
jgi:hypothetical protein